MKSKAVLSQTEAKNNKWAMSITIVDDGGQDIGAIGVSGVTCAQDAQDAQVAKAGAHSLK